MAKTNSEKLGAILSKSLEDYETVKYCLEGLDEDTKRGYLVALPRFILEIGKDPDTIIEERRKDLESDDRKIRGRWEQIVKAWYDREYKQAEEEGRSTHTPYTYFQRIQGFFDRNRYSLKFKKKEIKRPYSINRKIEITKEDVRAIWSFTETHRDKALLLTLAQSGISEIDACKLDAKDFPIEELEKPPFYFEGHRGKTKILFQTCLGEDACEEIVRMLKARGNPKEGPLFVSVHGKRLTPRVIRETLGPIGKLAEVQGFQVKLLRDFFHDALARAELTQRVIDRMFGHELGGARGAYTISRHTIVNAYKKAWKYLTINSEVRGARAQEERMVNIEKMVIGLTRIIASRFPREEAKTLRDELEKIGVSEDFLDKALPLPRKRV